MKHGGLEVIQQPVVDAWELVHEKHVGIYVKNGGFEDWSGLPLAPDFWSPDPSPWTNVTQEGVIVHSDNYSSHHTYSGGLTSDLHSSSLIPFMSEIHGSPVTARVWVYCTGGISAYLRISANFSTGVNAKQISVTQDAWEELVINTTPQLNVGGQTTYFRVDVQKESGTGSIYVDDASMYITATEEGIPLTSYNIPGLDSGNNIYRLVMRIVNPLNAVTTYRFGFDSEVSANNISTQRIIANDSTISADVSSDSHRIIGASGNINGVVHADLLLTGDDRTCNSLVGGDITGSVSQQALLIGHAHYSPNPFTSIQILADRPNGMGEGTYIALYKKPRSIL